MALRPMYERCGYACEEEFLDKVLIRDSANFSALLVPLLVIALLLLLAIKSPSVWTIALLAAALGGAVLLLFREVGTVFVCKDRLVLLTLMDGHIFPWASVEYVHLDSNRLKLGIGGSERTAIGLGYDCESLHMRLEAASRRGDIPNTVVIR